MPFDFFIDKEQHTLFWRAWGKITDEDLANNQDAIQSHPDYLCTLKQFNDLTGVDKVRITPKGLHRLKQNRLGEQGNKLAIIVASDLLYGLGRMFQMMDDLTPFDIRVFRNADDARLWLGIKLDNNDLEMTQKKSG